jgi:glycosyltransferase involved in cell wall biosynthesis
VKTKVVFSIIICTYNGSGTIQQTLKHISALCVDDSISVEVILVDNNSTDNVSSIAAAYWQQLFAPFPLYVYTEAKPGKSYALAQGIQKAQGDLIIICDDDNWLQQDYLKVALDKFRQHADLGIAGGVSIPVANRPLPEWFEAYGYCYACGKRAEKEFDFTGGKFLWGAGMVIPRHLALKIAGIANPQLLTCRKKDELISGGDDELCLRTWLLGYRTIFFPDLVLQHFIADDRLTVTYRNKLLEGFSVQSETINAYRVFYSVKKEPNRFILGFKKLLHLFWCKLSGDTYTIKIIRNYLFFISGGVVFKNPINRAILAWYNANK